jgi:hypothetical protein
MTSTMRLIRRAALGAALLSVLCASVAYAHGDPDQVNDPETGTSFSCGAGGGTLSQGFTPSRRRLAAVDVTMRKGGSFPWTGVTLTGRVRSGSATGAVLGTASAFVGLSAPDVTRVHFDLSSPLTLEPRGVFVFQLDAVSPTILSWMGRDDNPYAGGTGYGCGGGEIPIVDLNFVSYTPADAESPDTSILRAPSAATTSRARSATIGFGGIDDLTYAERLVFRCELDSVPVMPCASPVRLRRLRDGKQVFVVRAVDEAGREDASPATVEWRVDATPPSKPVVRGPRRTSERRVVYRFSSRDRVDGVRRLRFRCAMDSRRLQPCKATIVRRLSEGRHVLRVVAVDRAGNVSRPTTVSIVRT